jgi:signal transduction histidine kinase
VDRRAPLSTNSRIAAVLLDVLVASGDRGAAHRALQAAGGEEAVECHGDWVADETLSAMFRAADGARHLPERVGRALVGTPGTGFLLRYGGVATPEKAYRRCDQILAREQRGSLYEATEVSIGRARIRFHPGERANAQGAGAQGASPDPLYCTLRRAMLEGIPTVYGLLPARVREVECSSEGAPCCVYDVRWRRTTRVGLAGGASIGLAVGLSLAFVAGVPLWGVPMAGGLLALICAAAGRSIDLAYQLEAVAGARRGQLAMLDQADRRLAEKMDQFARLDAAERASHDRAAPRSAVRAQGGMANGDPSADFQPVDLAAVVRRAVDSQGSYLADGPSLEVELPSEPCLLEGEPIQLEMVVVQLIRNAAAAVALQVAQARSAGSPGSPGSGGCVRVSLRNVGDTLELAVEDDGPGIEEETVDEVFDPFVAQASESARRGLGLTVAFRVVKEHGGELRIESAQGQGTLVTASLPRSHDHGPEDTIPGGR